MKHRPLRLLLAAASLAAGFIASPLRADEALDRSLDAVAPDVQKWAAVCVVTTDAAGTPHFTWHDWRGTADRTDFWPASTIKLYAVVAALELLTERGYPLDTTVTFSHGSADGTWTVDCARTVREMLSEVFRRSSNEDYTLLLRLVGLDRLNSRFLVPEKGFAHSALMRGYVLGRPYGYVREEPQRIRLSHGARSETHEHTWTGRSYSEERGATVIDAKTGNVTTPRELVECLRRVLFHEKLPAAERYALTREQLAFLRSGGGGLTGLETRNADSGPYAWTGAAETVFPAAKFWHKCGLISNYALEIAAVDDTAHGGPFYLLAPVAAAGSSTTPVTGQKIITEMSRRIAEWAKSSAPPPQPAGR